MIKYKKLLLVILMLLTAAFSYAFADDDFELRDYDGIKLAKGTFIPVISLGEISTLYNDEQDKVEFSTTTDLYLRDINIIPQNSRITGYIEKINEPIVGTHASIVIKVTKLKFSDGFEIPFKGYVYSPSGNKIGGGMTAPASYIKKVSRRQGFLRMQTGYVPGPTRKMGEHIDIAPGASLLIILNTPIYITHTVTN